MIRLLLEAKKLAERLASSDQAGGQPVKEAWINRRMRKTACPVVWKGREAQSPRPHPILFRPGSETRLQFASGRQTAAMRSH